MAEAYNQGWIATRWIPGGVGVYMGFLLMAPRLHALGKSRGYVTISEFIFDRYLPPSGAPWVRAGWVGMGDGSSRRSSDGCTSRGEAKREGTGLVAVHAVVCESLLHCVCSVL